jgi:anti-sigma factor RsiW
MVWLLDDEIEPTLLLELEAHLNDCTGCRATLEREARLRDTVRRAVSTTVAPPALRHRIHDVLDRDRRGRTLLAQWWPAAAAAVVLVALMAKGGTGIALPDLDEAALRHARDLPLDVVAADVGQVQRYFAGKLPFAVQLPHVGDTPVRLLGGRVTHVRDREAAYVRYEVPSGRVAVFVYEDPGAEISELAPLYRVGRQRMVVQTVRGFTVARWRAGGLVYSIVTDLPPQEIPRVLTLDAGRR